MAKTKKTKPKPTASRDADTLGRIARALERLAPPPPPAASLAKGEAFVWHADESRLEAVAKVNRVDLALLQGVERQRESLLDNTRRFAKGLPANNALLWGARGMGKSSLVKAVHGAVNTETKGGLALVEIHREDIPTLPRVLGLLREAGRHLLQVAEGGARRRHRGPAGKRDLLCHVESAASHAARHDRQ